MTSKSYEQKVAALSEQFANCTTPQQRYERIIVIGKQQPSLPTEAKTDENRVQGCQSMMHLSSKLENGVMVFAAESDALIANGLAAILVNVYSGEKPAVVLQASPTFLQDLQIIGSLSPNRANGLAALHLRMKQEALRCCAGV